MTIEPFWAQISEPTLRQGDLLPRCLVPVPAVDFATDNGSREGTAGKRSHVSSCASAFHRPSQNSDNGLANGPSAGSLAFLKRFDRKVTIQIRSHAPGEPYQEQAVA
jgi:hypothetical protein